MHGSHGSLVFFHPNTYCISLLVEQILNSCGGQVLCDVMEALQAINGNGDWALISIVVVISLVAKDLDKVSFCHIPGRPNETEHWTAKFCQCFNCDIE